MISTKNTRSQAVPLYRSKKQWHSAQFSSPNSYLLFPASHIPAVQLIMASGGVTSSKVVKVSDGSDLLSGGGVDKTTRSYDLNKDDVNETIVSIPSAQQGFGQSVESNAYLELVINGTTWYSEPFCMTSGLTHRLSWTNSCNKNFAYYDDGFTNFLYFKGLYWNAPETEVERKFTLNGLNEKVVNKIVPQKIYSFTIEVPDYLLDAYHALEHHDSVIIENLETGEQHHMTNIEIEVASDIKDAYHEITVKYKIKQDEQPFGYQIEDPFSVGCCNPIGIDTVECEPEGGQGIDCTGFDVNINVAGEVLTYTLSNEPAEGTLNQQWFLDGVPIGNGSSVTMGEYGVYRVQVSKGNCFANDEHTKVDVCAGWTVTPAVNGLVIAANSSGETAAVTYEVFDDQSASVATSLPYTAPSDGTYTLVASMGDCERTFVLNAASGVAAHTASIVKSGSDLTGNSSGCTGTLTHRWELDEGNGPIVQGTNQTITATKNGLYIYYAICDGVEASAQKVVLDVCFQVQICNPEEIQTTVQVTGQLESC